MNRSCRPKKKKKKKENIGLNNILYNIQLKDIYKKFFLKATEYTSSQEYIVHSPE